MVSPFLSQESDNLMIWRDWWENCLLIWAGWPRTWSLQAQQANPYPRLSQPHFRRSGSEVADDGVGVGAGHFWASLSVSWCLFSRQMVGGDVAHCPSCLPWGRFPLTMCYTSRGNGICSEDRSRRYPYSLSVASLALKATPCSFKAQRVTSCSQLVLMATAKEHV